jgi:hypothetical protein
LVCQTAGIYFVVNAVNLQTHTFGIGILTEVIDTGPFVAADQVSATIFEAGSFQAKELLTDPGDPVDVYAMRQRFVNNGIYLEGWVMEMSDIDPELLADLRREGAKKERTRLKALETMRTPETSAQIDKAIEDGSSPESIAMELLEVIKKNPPQDGAQGSLVVSKTKSLADALGKARPGGKAKRT